MTLTPETRVLLTDALRPPAGFRVDVAVGTTYSLNLTALLLAPLSFALFDHAISEDLRGVDPIRLLEAVRRHAEHTTVFCQAGGIHVPDSYRSILTFVEDSVLEVLPTREGSIFHPKVWALRFVDPAGGHRHRVVVLSRNMTLDRSWDTALVLDESSDGVIPAGPAADFVAHLPTLALRPVDAPRLAEIEDLAESLGRVTLAAPTPFTTGELLPIGISDTEVWPFPHSARRMLAISPFLTRPALAELGRVSSQRTLVSRPEALELIGSQALTGWQVQVLQRLAETDPGDDIAEAAPARTEYHATRDGLHAKTFVLDLHDARSMVVTGSANLTSRRWGHGVEFDAVLIGPTSACGVAAVLDGRPEAPGLTRLLQDYSVAEEDGVHDAAIDTSYALESFHQGLARSAPDLHVVALDGDRVDVTLTLAVPDAPPGETTVWLASLSGEAHRQPLGPRLSWTIAAANVTPFLAVETTAGTGEARVTRRCVLKATLSGAVDGRRQDAVRSILTSREQVLRYLVFLLGDPSYDALFAEIAGVGDGSEADNQDDRPWAGAADVALLEPLVRAVGRDTDALARVASLVEELRALPDGADLIPAGFEDLWDVVWQVHSEDRSS